jgi:hypothetical protein
VSVIAWGRRIQCDACLKQAEVEGEYDQSRAFLDEPVPWGWTSMRAVTAAVIRLELKEFYGGPISHLCDECSALPVGHLVAKMSARFEALAKAERDAK